MIILQSDSEHNSLGFVPEANRACGRCEQIDITTVDAFCTANGICEIDVLKTDAQGFDVDVLRGAANLLGRAAVCFVYAEVGFSPDDRYNTPFADLDRHLRDNGFQLTGFYEQGGMGATPPVMAFCNALYAHPLAIRRRFRRTATSGVA
jgi:hypothetical protein